MPIRNLSTFPLAVFTNVSISIAKQKGIIAKKIDLSKFLSEKLTLNFFLQKKYNIIKFNNANAASI